MVLYGGAQVTMEMIMALPGNEVTLSLLLVFLLLPGCGSVLNPEPLGYLERNLNVVEEHEVEPKIAMERIRLWALRYYNYPDEAIIIDDRDAFRYLFKDFTIVQRNVGEMIPIGYGLTVDVRPGKIRFIYTIGEPTEPTMTLTSDLEDLKEHFVFLVNSILSAMQDEDSF